MEPTNDENQTAPLNSKNTPEEALPSEPDNAQEEHIDAEKGIIAWFARNSVAANLLMIFIIVGGLSTATIIRKQMFPEFEISNIEITAVYPGAAPQEIEESIAIKIEEALDEVQGIERVTTKSNRNLFTADIKVYDNYELKDVLDDVKLQIDTISNFPAGMERPTVRQLKYQQEVMYISLYGDLSYRELRNLGQEIYDDIQNLPQINISTFYTRLNYEIGIEVSKEKLREYQLTFDDIATAIRATSTNMSAGQVRAEDGFITLRVEQQAYNQSEYTNIPIKTLPDGSKIYLGELATIHDDFEEGIQYDKFNNKPSVFFFVGASRDQSIDNIATTVRTYIDQRSKTLPENIKLEYWVDFTYYLDGRLKMMLDNMVWGGLLVFMILALFLRIRLSFWVMMGLPVSFLGTLLFMPTQWIDITINITSLFGFILVLGIVVDDAIVIGESAASEIEKNGVSLKSAIVGAKRVAMPATFGVLTTIAAFFPMLVAEGPGAAFSKAIGGVVVLCLIFSLVESKLILPAHLARMKAIKDKPKNPLVKIRSAIDSSLKTFIDKVYLPFMQRALHYRYTVISTFIGIMLVSIGAYQGGLIKFIGTPKIPHDYPAIFVTMQESTSEQTTLNAILTIEQIIKRVDKEIEASTGKPTIANIQVSLRGRTQSEIIVKLLEQEDRVLDTFQIAEKWREAIPAIPGLKTLRIQDSLFGFEKDDGDVRFNLYGKDYAQLSEATKKLRQEIAKIQGITDINDSVRTPSKEIQFELKPLAYSLGLSAANIASQANNAFYGLEVQRIIRDTEEIKVMLRYPESERNAVAYVDDLNITTPNGTEVPLASVANTLEIESEDSINRENGSRSVSIWADVNSDVITPFEVAKQVNNKILPKLLAEYSGITTKTDGKVKEEQEGQKKQSRDSLLSLMIIFALLAIPLKSYTQPLIVMSVIPFGVIGAMIGHMIFGLNMSSLSIFGIIAAAGVVINDSLVMIDFINKARLQGFSTINAVLLSGCRRFRAIILTSLTTFIGLIPIISETSMQAKIVIPMAISLAFGVLFATVITLILIPCLYLFFEDIGNLARAFLSIFGSDNTRKPTVRT